LEVGDSLSRSIDKGLANSRFGIVVISPNFIKKKWPERELRGLVAREVDEEQRVILPIWLGVTNQEVKTFSPPLADSLALRANEMSGDEIALTLLKTIRPDIYNAHTRADLEKMLPSQDIQDLQDELEYVKAELSSYQCPYCDAPLTERTYLPKDPELEGAEVAESFACGYTAFDGNMKYPCPEDERFPKLDEYEIQIKENPLERLRYQAFLIPKTDNARRLFFDPQMGHTEEEAKQRIIDMYDKRAKHWQ